MEVSLSGELTAGGPEDGWCANLTEAPEASCAATDLAIEEGLQEAVEEEEEVVREVRLCVSAVAAAAAVTTV